MKIRNKFLMPINSLKTEFMMEKDLQALLTAVLISMNRPNENNNQPNDLEREEVDEGRGTESPDSSAAK